MRLWPVALALLAGALLVRTSPAPAGTAAPECSAKIVDEPWVETPTARRAALVRAGVDLTAAFEQSDDRGDRIERLEEELQARVIEDEAAREELMDAFLSETDPERLSFLQNVLASHPPLRNDAAWQERFVAVAEKDGLSARRRAALLFLQQAEAIGAVHERLLTLAENGGEMRAPALIALKGLPQRRLPDPRLAALAGRLADEDRDPRLRALALVIEADRDHARRYAEDPDPDLRSSACRVLLDAETDPSIRRALTERLDAIIR